MADQRLFQRNLRDLVNVPASQMATPGAKVGELAAAHYGEKAMEDARARADESQSEMKELSLAQTAEKAGKIVDTRQALHETEMAAGKRMSDRATLFAGLGTAIKLGSVAMKEKETKKIMDRLLGQVGRYDELKAWMTAENNRLLGMIGERVKTFRSAFRGESAANHDPNIY